MKLTQKQLIFIVGIGTLIIAGGLVGLVLHYNGQPTTNTASTNATNTNVVTNENTNTSQNARSDWNTYTNSEVEYSIQYPQDWSLEETDHPSELVKGTTAYYIVLSDPRSTYRLHLGVRIEGDTTKDIWYRTGIGAGDIGKGDIVTIAGTDQQLWKLVFEDNTYEIFSNDLRTHDWPVINGKEFVFTFGCNPKLDYDASQACLTSEIAETPEYQTMKEIVSTLSLSTAVTDSAGWKTYKTSESDIGIYEKENPSFSFQYVDGWDIDEELGGIHIHETENNGQLVPEISISGGAHWPLNGKGDRDNVLVGCKAILDNGSLQYTLDEERSLTLDNKPAAYLSYSVPDGVYQTDEHRNYFYGACIKENDDTMLIVTGKPRDSDFIQRYFDTFIHTISIDTFVDPRTGTEVGSDYQYSNENLGMSFLYPQSWHIQSSKCQDGPGCDFIRLYAVALDSDTDTSSIKQRVEITRYPKLASETNEATYARIADIYYLDKMDPQPSQDELFGNSTYIYVINQYTASNGDFDSLVASFKLL